MFKLLIIDDDYFTRLGIKEAINWNEYDIEVIATKENGKTGLECALKENPDLIICDVRMPLISGVEFVKEVKPKVDCEIVMLSGYGDYPYVKECFLNGVFSYLIKPIENDVLLQNVLNAKEKLIESRKEKKYINILKSETVKLRELFINDILANKEIEDINYKLDLYNIDLNNPYLMYIHLDQNEYRDNFISILSFELNKSFIKFTLESVNEDYLVFIYDDINKEKIYSIMQSISDEYEKQGSTLSIAISNNINDINSFIDSIKKIKALTESKLFPMISSINFIDEEPKKYKTIIVQAMNYIALNYNKRISAKSVADELFVSPSNLMHQFKDELGKTFNDCLTNYRIIMAKKLLRSGKYKIYEVSDMVGYDDVRYFSQIFRQVTGLKPTEYGTEFLNPSND